MRMRKKKNSEARLLACKGFVCQPVEKQLDDPSAEFGKSNAPVFLEIGAGKGRFACAMAQRHSDACYFAMERVTDCVVLAAERAASGEYGALENLKFIIDTADNLPRIFKSASIDAIFLNFSDPWSKKGYAKRRLTHRRYLAMYMNLLRDGGILRFKTDNVGLFDFSREEIEAMGLECNVVTRDLHSSEWNDGNIMTEYEENFSSQGIKINMLEVKKPIGFVSDIPEDFLVQSQYFRRNNG